MKVRLSCTFLCVSSNQSPEFAISSISDSRQSVEQICSSSRLSVHKSHVLGVWISRRLDTQWHRQRRQLVTVTDGLRLSIEARTQRARDSTANPIITPVPGCSRWPRKMTWWWRIRRPRSSSSCNARTRIKGTCYGKVDLYKSWLVARDQQ